jgi:L-asparaginase
MHLTLIETGGTICMTAGPNGLRPAPEKVAAALAQIAPGQRLDHQKLDPLIDSADLGPTVWNALLDRIDAAPGPVIITHGTDTMAFTGAALDAALAGPGGLRQGRAVVLTGSMHPLGVAGSDAEGNLALAIQTALGGEAGLHLAFNGNILPAGRVTKQHSQNVAAFGLAGDAGAPLPAARRFDTGKSLGLITLTPGLAARALAAMLAPLDGAVLRVFGAGTMPAALAETLMAAKGKPMIAVSQCAGGGLEPGAYAAGAPLWTAGAENGGQMSAEQALARLWLRLSAAPPNA